MEFRTKQIVLPPNQHISYESILFSMGSCFAENIGNRLRQRKFDLFLNPSGIIYNPMSIAQSIESCMEPKTAINESDIFEMDGIWHSWNHHGSFSDYSKENLVKDIQNKKEQAFSKLKDASFLFLTWGSAFVYEKIIDGKIVANCHKYPAKHFAKRLLDKDEIVLRYKQLIEKLIRFNPTIQIIWSISPVKHIKDGLHENNLSKSTLLLAMNELVSSNDFCYYFPAYELVQDELRDYRFYKEDMAHPNEQAIEFVWQSFTTHCFEPSTLALMKQVESIQTAMLHRPIRPNTVQHQKFKLSQLSKIEQLQKQLPQLDWEKELSFFN